jgi:hypothetical protein
MLGADRHSVLRCKPVGRVRVADELRQVGASGLPKAYDGRTCQALEHEVRLLRYSTAGECG